MANNVVDEEFQAQIVGGKRQLTIPAKMMKQLGLKPGDFLKFSVRGKDILKATPCRVIPIDQLPEETLMPIRASSDEIAAGRFETFNKAGDIRDGADSDEAKVKPATMEEMSCKT
jgi:bifunctional DNA-binding transcriptional regulator/antitoxin component of YhaV-PrlF toxin-antitoxin module